MSKTPSVATFQLVGGKTQQIPIANFVTGDETYLKNWSEEGALFLQHCHSLTIHELLTLRKYQSFKFERRGNHIFVDGTLNENKVTYMIDNSMNADSQIEPTRVWPVILDQAVGISAHRGVNIPTQRENEILLVCLLIDIGKDL